MGRVEYDYKEDLNILPDVAIKNKIVASDMNDIKDAINNNDYILSITRDVPLGGLVIWYTQNNIPNKFMLVNGQALSRTKYEDLFNVIGTTYGDGDGSTTFNLPNQNANPEGVAIPNDKLPNYYYIMRVKM